MNNVKCPTCDKRLYSAVKTSLITCPYCTALLAATHENKRAAERLPICKFCRVIKDQFSVTARTIDISDTGVGIKSYRTLPFANDEIVGIFVEDLNLVKKARVAWTMSIAEISTAGLAFCA